MHSSLKAARSRADLTMSELAEKSGVAIDTISAIERGVRVPQARTLHKLARALGVDPAILIREEINRRLVREKGPPPASPIQ